jgi:hypothetical protein
MPEAIIVHQLRDRPAVSRDRAAGGVQRNK